MKVYRYMSWKEFADVTAHIPLVSDNHTCSISRTNSEGFCFLPESVTFTNSFGDSVTLSPVDCYDFLSGIVSDEVLVEFQVLKPEILAEGFGVYADPTSGGWYDRISIKEYSTPEYSDEELEPVRYYVLGQFGAPGVWYEYH